MINVISLGAGKQSSYMLLNALEGKYKYMPDYAIFSDTGCEPEFVYKYLDWLKDYVLDKYNFKIHIVSKGNLKEDIEKYIDKEIFRVSQIPLWLESGGLVTRQCTGDYKIAPLRKKLKELRGKNRVRLWIGISLDEIERVKNSSVKYIENYYPLIENRITIDQIVAWFANNNLQEPGKSACLICPFHSFNYWSMLKRYSKEEFAKACDFDNRIRIYPRLNSKTYLSSFRKPLKEIDFSQHPSLFPELIEECEGLCGL